MSWPVGRPGVSVLISERQIERVAPNLEGGQANLAAAARHLASAAMLADSDPEGAYALVYDAARKSVFSTRTPAGGGLARRVEEEQRASGSGRG